MKWEAASHKIQNDDSERNIFLHFKCSLLMMNLKEWIFFLFFFLFGCLKLEFLMDFLKVALKLVYMQKEVCLNNAASVMLSIFACFTSIWTNRRSLCACWTCSVHTTARQCGAGCSVLGAWLKVTVKFLSVPKSCCQILHSREFSAHYLLYIGLVPRTIECRKMINSWLWPWL